MRIMQSFGYFAMHDIIGTYPIFNKVNGRIFLEDMHSPIGMSFHFSVPNKSPKNSYSKLFMSTFDVQNNGNMSLVDKQNTFKLKIVDPVGRGRKNDKAIKEYLEKKRVIFNDLETTKEFYVDFLFASFKIYISKTPISEFKDKLDSFTDNEIYIYVERLLKVSEYIHFIDDERLALSLRTASLVKFTPDKFNALKKGDISIFNEDEILQLKEMLFITSLCDEYEQLQLKRKKAFKTKNDFAGFTILTTTRCNARCDYCYEKGMPQISMSKQTEQEIVELICSTSAKKINISWFGGEPLMNSQAINYITSKLCENNIAFSSSMISNGYLIDYNITNISKWNLKNVQITLDGIFDKYNKIKNFIHKGDAFHKVISNIELLLKNNVNVSIRLNFNKDNYHDILECIDYLYNKFGNQSLLKIYPHHIFDTNFYLDDGSNLYLVIFKKMIDCGFVKNLTDLGFKPKSFSCFVHNANHLVIGPDGKLYSCEHITTEKHEKCIGDIKTGITDLSAYNYWLDISYPYKKCEKCKYVFFCQGGCKNERDKMADSCCIAFLDSIDEIIKYYHKNKRKEN